MKQTSAASLTEFHPLRLVLAWEVPSTGRPVPQHCCPEDTSTMQQVPCPYHHKRGESQANLRQIHSLPSLSGCDPQGPLEVAAEREQAGVMAAELPK